MRERPILFSAPMVRAILEGRKTQTRRIVKMTERATAALVGAPPPAMEGDRARWVTPPLDSGADYDAWNAWCPYGEPGARLWVRETWAAPSDYDDLSPKQIDAMHSIERVAVPLWYAATDTTEAETYTAGRWRPSIHCPRWASRITLRVTSVRVERLQAITEEDARAEGVTPFSYDPEGDCWTAAPPERAHRTAFEYIWGELNGYDEADERRPGSSWSSNPWVWVVGFEREVNP